MTMGNNLRLSGQLSHYQANRLSDNQNGLTSSGTFGLTAYQTYQRGLSR